MEDPILRRRDRTPTITVRGDIANHLQPPDVSVAIMKQLNPIVDALPAGYRIDMAGSIEESGKATQAMIPLFPIMIAMTLLIIILQVRSMAAMVMVFLTAPLGLIGVVPTLLLFNQPFGINTLVGLIALSGAQAGPIGRALMAGSETAAAEQALELAALFPHRFYLELQRAGLKVRIRWPMSAASASAAWLREILR